MNGLPEKCPRCGAPTALYVVRDGSTLVCRNCGYVFEEAPIDIGPEWRVYTPEERLERSRVGAPPTERIHDRGITTIIRASRRDLRGQKLEAIQSRLRVEQDRRLVEILGELDRAIARLGLPNHVAETAAKLLRMMYKQGVVRRSNAPEYIAASIFAAARINSYTLTMKDIVEIVDTDIQRAWHAYRRLIERVRVRSRPLGPAHYVSQVVSKLKLSSRVENLALRFTQLLIRSGLAQGKPPQPLAAAAVYLASILLDEKRNQSEVAQAVNVSDATIRNRYRDIVDNFYIEVML